MRYVALLIIMSGFLGVSGCGRYSKPQLPRDAFYPHVYFVQSAEEETEKGQEESENIPQEIDTQKTVNLDLNKQLHEVKSGKTGRENE